MTVLRPLVCAASIVNSSAFCACSVLQAEAFSPGTNLMIACMLLQCLAAVIVVLQQRAAALT